MASESNQLDPIQRVIQQAFDTLVKRSDVKVIEVAEQLGVTRDAVYRYARGDDTPGADKLLKAMRAWDLVIQINGEDFGRQTLRRQPKKRGARGVQLQLFDPQFIHTESAHADLRMPPGRAETLEVSLKLLLSR